MAEDERPFSSEEEEEWLAKGRSIRPTPLTSPVAIIAVSRDPTGGIHLRVWDEIPGEHPDGLHRDENARLIHSMSPRDAMFLGSTLMGIAWNAIEIGTKPHGKPNPPPGFPEDAWDELWPQWAVIFKAAKAAHEAEHGTGGDDEGWRRLLRDIYLPDEPNEEPASGS